MSAPGPAVDLAVIGGGPAGMSAALAAAEHGASVCLIDEGLDLGGQIYRKPTCPERAPAPHPRGERLRRQVAARQDRIEVRSETAVWGIFDPLAVTVARGETSEVIRPRALVLAPGAYEYTPPFPGWTLPGVMTPGGAQVLAKTMGVAPGERAVVAGSGPFLLVVATQLIRAGVEVQCVLEASPQRPWLKLPLSGWRTPGLLKEGLGYLAELKRHGIPVRYGRVAIAAEGKDRLTTVVHAPVDETWTPDRSRAERVEADTLCVGYGFVPRTSLAQMAGCKLAFRPEVGGWVPERGRDLETSVPNLLVAGDGGGSAGALVAAFEGRLAGLAAVRHLGLLDAERFEYLRTPIDRKLGRIGHLRRALDAISVPRPGLHALLEDDTIVCRCEELSWKEVRDGIDHGATRYRSLKVVTRVGMGACQGRFCWPAMARATATVLGCPIADVGPANRRPPDRPLTLGALAALEREA